MFTISIQNFSLEFTFPKMELIIILQFMYLSVESPRYLTLAKAVLLLRIFMFFVSCVCYAFVCVCLYVPCGHLLGKG